jgi:dienelactone hydrolase
VLTVRVDTWPGGSDGIREQMQKLGSAGDSHPVGYYGPSQGGEMGMRLVAAEPRIKAAVLGLIGSDWLTGTAARITIPVEFVVQRKSAHARARRKLGGGRRGNRVR